MNIRALLMIAAVVAATPVGAADLAAEIEITTLTLPAALETTSWNWCTWEWCNMGPRLFHEIRADGTIYVGWTDSSGNGRLSLVAGGTIQTTYTYTGTPVKGLVVHADGSFAVLLWTSASDVMHLSKRAADNTQQWSADLNTYSPVTYFNNGIGDSRLAYGGGLYGAYYAIHCSVGWCAGHEGDQFKWVNDSGTVTTRWEWGCSHSMAELVSYHPTWDTLTAICSSDCYPGKGIFVDHNHTLFVSDGDCGGLVATQLGQMAAGDNDWKVVFSALDRPCCDAYGIGFATFDDSYSTNIVWLTNTDGSTERDPVLARLADSGGSERFLVGWRTDNDGDFHLGIINAGGTFLEGPQSVGGDGISWRLRDDSFRSHTDGSVTWVDGAPSSTSLRLYRYTAGSIFSDGFESGTTSAWDAAVP